MNISGNYVSIFFVLVLLINDGSSLSFIQNSMLTCLKFNMIYLSTGFTKSQLNEYFWQLFYHICLFHILNLLVFILELQTTFNVIISGKIHYLCIHGVLNEVTKMNIAGNCFSMFFISHYSVIYVYRWVKSEIKYHLDHKQ